MSKPTEAILWTNGMLMVFDQNGEQVPEYQGEGKEMMPKLRADFPSCPVKIMHWSKEKS